MDVTLIREWKDLLQAGGAWSFVAILFYVVAQLYKAKEKQDEEHKEDTEMLQSNHTKELQALNSKILELATSQQSGNLQVGNAVAGIREALVAINNRLELLDRSVTRR